MKSASLFCLQCTAAGLAVAGIALFVAPAASAQASAPFYSFVVDNLTSSNGDPVYSVYDPLTFSAVQVDETFADSFTQTLSIADAVGTVQTTDIVPSALQPFTFVPGVGYTDPVHGALTSAVLTGILAFPGIPPTNPLSVTLLTSPSGTPYEQPISTSFSASLFGPAPSGVAVGTFSLLNLGSSQETTVDIDVQAVPEASTMVSLGVLIALGLGSLGVLRRKHCAAAAD